MKKSKLINLIKEELKSILNEEIIAGGPTNEEYCAGETCGKFTGCPTPCDCNGDDGEGKPCKYNGDSPNAIHKPNSKAKKSTKKLNEVAPPQLRERFQRLANISKK